MIRTLCTFLVLACVAGLIGVLTGHLRNRYADENGLGFSEISERILAARATLVDVAQGYSGCYRPAGRSNSGSVSVRRVISLQS